MYWVWMMLREAPKTSEGRGAQSLIPNVNGPSTNRVCSVNDQQNGRANRQGWVKNDKRLELADNYYDAPGVDFVR